MKKAYFVVVTTGIFLLFALFLFFTNYGMECDVHLIFKTFENQSVGLILLISAIAGVFIWQALVLFTKASWKIYKLRKAQSASLEKEDVDNSGDECVESEIKGSVVEDSKPDIEETTADHESENAEKSISDDQTED